MSHTRPPRRRLAAIAAVCAPFLIAGLALSAGSAAATGGHHGPPPTAQPLPAAIGVVKNLDIGVNGTIVGAASSEEGVDVLQFSVHRNKVVTRTLATLPAGSAQAAQSSRGHTWVIYGAAGGPEEPPPPGVQGPSAWLVDKHGKAKMVLDIAVFQSRWSPDPYDLEGAPADSNPYDVEALADGSALIADAAGNDLIRVWPNGRAVTVACFPDEVVPTDQVPPEVVPPGELPPAIPAEAVPTGVSLGPDGMAYVSELKGFPFPLNESKVWRIDPDKRGMGCLGDPENPRAPGKVAADGFSGINDVTVDHKGALYVTELSTLGIWAVEGAFEDPTPIVGTGRVSKVWHGTTTTVGDTPLTVPGSAVVTKSGQVYVSDQHLFGALLTRIR